MRFEKISKYKDCDIQMPVRKTISSAGYDMVAAEDTVIPPYDYLYEEMFNFAEDNECDVDEPKTLYEMEVITKGAAARPTLVPTGMKCELEKDCYLELSVRSSSPLKYWLIMANSKGIIDADYYNNPDNEGHIYFQLINLSPFPIIIKKGEAIGQGIIHKYKKVDGDFQGAVRLGGFGSTDSPLSPA